MSGKLKLLLVILALGALSSTWHISAYIRSATSTPAAVATIAQPLDIRDQLDDDDRDGLTNRDETYWATNTINPDTDGDGFLDGEEVLSGHDPRKPGPKDYLDPGKNLTQRTIDLAIGGMIVGDLKPDSPDYATSVAAIADTMAQQYQKNTTIVLDSLSVVTDTPETKGAYLRAMSDVLLTIIVPATKDVEAFLKNIEDVSLSDTSALTTDTKRYKEFTATTRRLSASMGDRATRLAAIPVPRSFVPQNQSAVRILRTFQKYFELLGNLKNDPLQGSIILSSMLKLQYESMHDFTYDFAYALATKLK